MHKILLFFSFYLPFIFAGIERVFKYPFNQLGKFKVGVYVTGSAANQFRNPVEFKIGITTWDKRSGKWF